MHPDEDDGELQPHLPLQVPTLGREVGGCALMFGCYEAFKRQAAHVQVFTLNATPKSPMSCVSSSRWRGVMWALLYVSCCTRIMCADLCGRC